MLPSDPDVSDLLKRVMSQAPAPVQDRAPQHSADGDCTVDPVFEEDQPWRLPGICGQTRVTTNFGQVPAQLLRVGDRVRTRSGRYLAIKHIRETKLDCQFVEQRPDSRPVVIPRGSLDRDLPREDVLLSPAQAVTVSFNLVEHKVMRARDLSRGYQPLDKTLGMIAYYEVRLETEDDVFCEGIWVKSAGQP